MNKSFFGGVVVSAEADAVARELIQEWHIPKLYNLAFLLNMNRCFDDHQVLRLWVQGLLDNEQIDLTDLSDQARQRFSCLVI